MTWSETFESTAAHYTAMDMQPGCWQYAQAQVADLEQSELWHGLRAEVGKRIKAVRVAVVARNSEYEKPEPGQACATTTQAMLDQWSDWAEFASIKTLPDWACYRYKAFETVIPLRNVLWAAF